MAMGGSGVSGSDRPLPGGGVDNIIEIARFFNSGENLTRMKELADKEKEVDEKISTLGGIERARNLIAEADEIRRRADDMRQVVLNDASTEAERLKAEARSERANAEATRRRAQAEFGDREERIESAERDIVKRLKELEHGEALLKSGQEKLRLAEKESSDLRNFLQGKLAALKTIAAGL